MKRMQHGDVHSVSNSGYSNAEWEKSNEKKMRNSLKKTDKSQSDENIAQNRETSNARMKLWLSSKKRRTNECSHFQSDENNRSTNGNNNNNNWLCINVNEKLTFAESSDLKWIRFWDLHEKRPNLRISITENQNHTKQFAILLVTLVQLASNLVSSKNISKFRWDISWNSLFQKCKYFRNDYLEKTILISCSHCHLIQVIYIFVKHIPKYTFFQSKYWRWNFQWM